jgi:hypothetical protein
MALFRIVIMKEPRYQHESGLQEPVVKLEFARLLFIRYLKSSFL